MVVVSIPVEMAVSVLLLLSAVAAIPLVCMRRYRRRNRISSPVPVSPEGHFASSVVVTGTDFEQLHAAVPLPAANNVHPHPLPVPVFTPVPVILAAILMQQPGEEIVPLPATDDR